jgi:redox-sensitive bicupin YhaK (pirin superfamily)
MNSIFHPASARGHVNFGWLDSHHSFSFGQWYEPEKVHFGALRVLNDDIVSGGGGFGLHPHDNMEIVSIPLSGSLVHKDSTGTDATIRTGEVQIMNAGTGIRHSEFNASKTDAVNFLQIWVIPKLRDIKPRHDQKAFDRTQRKNAWQVVVSPDEKDGAVWINQDALFSLADLEKGLSLDYKTRFPGNGVYFFVIEGGIEVEGKQISKKDALGISLADGVSIQALKNSEILAIEVPMIP